MHSSSNEIDEILRQSFRDRRINKSAKNVRLSW